MDANLTIVGSGRPSSGPRSSRRAYRPRIGLANISPARWSKKCCASPLRETSRAPRALPRQPLSLAFCPNQTICSHVLVEFAIQSAPVGFIRYCPTICCRNGGTFKSHRPSSRSSDESVKGEGGMDGSLLIGAPIGLGVLLAAGIVMVVMSYLTQ
jgi:hypothetical protein